MQPPYGYETGYCALLDIAENRIDSGHFEQLLIFDDVGQNPYKRQRYLELRSRLRSAVSPCETRQVYIKRGVKGAKASRSLSNAWEIENYLISQGFCVVDPDRQTAREIAEAVAGARLVVGIEGSHMLHAIYSAGDGASVCVLQPPNRFTNVIKDYTDCLGLHYGFTVGTESADGFFVPLDGMKRILDRMSAL